MNLYLLQLQLQPMSTGHCSKICNRIIVEKEKNILYSFGQSLYVCFICVRGRLSTENEIFRINLKYMRLYAMATKCDICNVHLYQKTMKTCKIHKMHALRARINICATLCRHHDIKCQNIQT